LSSKFQSNKLSNNSILIQDSHFVPPFLHPEPPLNDNVFITPPDAIISSDNNTTAAGSALSNFFTYSSPQTPVKRIHIPPEYNVKLPEGFSIGVASSGMEMIVLAPLFRRLTRLD
jgi:hypothetical protein